MRVIDLGHWLLTAWVVPTVVLGLAALTLGGWSLRSLVRDALSHRARARRFRLVGWTAIGASLVLTAAWPGVSQFSAVAIRPDGKWELRNCMGLPVSTVSPRFTRIVEGEDLGGLHLGAGRLRVHLDDGRTVDSVRISGEAFARVVEGLGYTADRQHDVRGSVRVDPHTYGASGPEWVSVQ